MNSWRDTSMNPRTATSLAKVVTQAKYYIKGEEIKFENKARDAK